MPIEALTDQSPMPFGAHKGVTMENVPARYLLWMYDKDDGLWCDNSDKNMPLRLYIENNIAALEMDAPDHELKNDPRKSR